MLEDAMLSISTILYPTDFTESSAAAFSVACSLARAYGARLVVLHVVLPPVGSAEVIERRDPEKFYSGLWQELRRLEPEDPGIRIEHRLVEGDAAGVILRIAEAIDANLIVMGTHGRTGLARLMLGSVAEEVLRHALCPVLTLKSSSPEILPKTAPTEVAASSTLAVGQ